MPASPAPPRSGGTPQGSHARSPVHEPTDLPKPCLRVIEAESTPLVNPCDFVCLARHFVLNAITMREIDNITRKPKLNDRLLTTANSFASRRCRDVRPHSGSHDLWRRLWLIRFGVWIPQYANGCRVHRNAHCKLTFEECALRARAAQAAQARLHASAAARR